MSPTSASRSAGDAFEGAAETFLRQQGLQPVARQVRYRCGEIDLVMRDASVLVLIEVRYRQSRRFGGALESVTNRKQRRIASAAALYLADHPELARLACRFDVVAIEGSLDQAQFDWRRDAFRIES